MQRLTFNDPEFVQEAYRAPEHAQGLQFVQAKKTILQPDRKTTERKLGLWLGEESRAYLVYVAATLATAMMFPSAGAAQNMSSFTRYQELSFLEIQPILKDDVAPAASSETLSTATVFGPRQFSFAGKPNSIIGPESLVKKVLNILSGHLEDGHYLSRKSFPPSPGRFILVEIVGPSPVSNFEGAERFQDVIGNRLLEQLLEKRGAEFERVISLRLSGGDVMRIEELLGNRWKWGIGPFPVYFVAKAEPPHDIRLVPLNTDKIYLYTRFKYFEEKIDEALKQFSIP